MTDLAPTLETERLRLRGFRADDLDTQAAMLGDPEVMRYVGGKPNTREEAWRRMLAAPGMWALLGYGYWAVERKEDGAFLGQAGFGDFKRDLEPSIEGVPEAGWMFAVHAHGRGYATEAVAATLRWGDDRLRGHSFAAIIDFANAPSIRLAEKMGFSERQEAVYHDETILLFRRPARLG
ncbi:MAG TPA: GNAT family N-acetyltransferase [Allosphingosinicella sp.]|nr:GNAT family N-acetyltransferase [Allosphingosinicella sp.]